MQLRDGQQIGFGYDALHRLTSRTMPGGSSGSGGNAWVQNYAYDNLGHLLSANDPNNAFEAFGWDALGRKVSENSASGGQRTMAYDLASRRIGLTWPDGFYVTYEYDTAGDLKAIKENGGASNKNDGYTINGLNQAITAGSTALGYDARGNTTSIGGTSYTYSSDNLLKTASNGVSLSYDPFDRLVGDDTAGAAGSATRFVYDGQQLAGETDPSGTITRRYVFGPGSDEPLVWYEGSGTSDRRFLHADERGSVIAVTDSAGTTLGVDSYDDYGVPAAGNIGRFQYTGQMWLPELGLYDYKARMYDPGRGRFLQTDPIGYGDGLNWYGYVGGDPVNATDPSGTDGGDIVVSGNPNRDCIFGVICFDPKPFFDRINETTPGPGDLGEGGGGGAALTPTPLPQNHRYTTSRRLTRMNTTCTAGQVSAATNRNSVPGSYGNHVNGSSYRVSTAFGFSPGTITFRSGGGGTAFTNITNSDHALCCGSVTTTISGNQRDGFIATVVGTGYNEPYGPFSSSAMAEINDALGPDIFNLQLQDINSELLGMCGG